ncbi:MAG: FAD-dependent monooxygenase [Gemmatimonadota bacterium]|nr:FAD-dependent monooxygenase [Gemmatimonadota bacterium]
MANILIVGAGPTGLTMAAVLARYGVRPRVIDRAVVPPDDRSRAVVIQARTLELFEDLGIVREVLDDGLIVEAANLFTHGGSRGSIRINPVWIDSAYGRFVSLPQDETERILGALVASSGIAVERGAELVGIEDGPSSATATVRHADGRTERMTADWILGCDGAHSAVRQLSGLPFPGDTYPDECLLGDVDMKWSLPDGEVAICPGEDGVLLAFPLPGRHRFRIIMILPATADPESRHLEAEEFITRVRSMTPRSATGEEPDVVTTRWLTRYRLHRRGVPAYRKGRCFVAGDAAHIHSPAGAQGMNTGIQDAYNLGWKLGLLTRGEVTEQILDTYNEERHRVGQKLLTSTDRFFAVLASGGPVRRFIRRVMPTIGIRLLTVPCIGPRIARFVSQTGIRYGNSALSTDGPGAAQLGRGAPRPGDRAPDVKLGAQRRLFELLRGPEFRLLLFAGDAALLVEQLAALAADVEARHGSVVKAVLLRHTASHIRFGEIDESAAAHRRYGAQRGAIYLIRPDGHIAFRGAPSDGDALRATLAHWLTHGDTFLRL